jgi:hypothetical protein
MVLSKGHEVVGLGYSSLPGDAARVTDGGELSNPNWVDRVHQEYDTDRPIDRVTRDSQGNSDGGSCQQVNWVTRVSQGNRDSNPKLGNSSRVTKNLATMESRGTEKLTNMESRVMEKSANT